LVGVEVVVVVGVAVEVGVVVGVVVEVGVALYLIFISVLKDVA
jgi:hypothetical protein